MKFKENILPVFMALVSAIAIFLLVFVLAYHIACLIVPPIFIDYTTGKEHGLMPIGQSIISIVFATIGSIPIFILVVKYFRKKRTKVKN